MHGGRNMARSRCAAFLWVATLLSALVGGSTAVLAQLTDENLVFSLPQGYKLGHQSLNNNIQLQEFVPQSETVENWTELVTAQIFRGRKGIDPGTFLRGTGERFRAACPGTQPSTIHSGQANGYRVSMLLLHCPLNPQTGKPEVTFFRAIEGNDSFYLVQKAFRFAPNQAQIDAAAKYLGTVNVCDSRLPAQHCPDLQEQGFHPTPMPR